mmetsp:Transcript_10840/g.34888  ORF Transcript_10840/g.34888 Transcript_10840/m.34888 type:complete len:260 (+) Transcript_10840:348-1127(+)|eukprot:scaffold1044_cov120-Isochrysis_galbana.AAC.4
MPCTCLRGRSRLQESADGAVRQVRLAKGLLKQVRGVGGAHLAVLAERHAVEETLHDGFVRHTAPQRFLHTPRLLVLDAATGVGPVGSGGDALPRRVQLRLQPLTLGHARQKSGRAAHPRGLSGGSALRCHHGASTHCAAASPTGRWPHPRRIDTIGCVAAPNPQIRLDAPHALPANLLLQRRVERKHGRRPLQPRLLECGGKAAQEHPVREPTSPRQSLCHAQSHSLELRAPLLGAVQLDPEQIAHGLRAQLSRPQPQR